MLRKLLAALTVSTFLTAVSAAPTQAAPVIGAVAAFAASQLGTIAINLAIAVGASLLSQLLRPKQQPPAEQSNTSFGMQLQLEVGGDNPIAFPVGRCATAGQLVYPGVWGQNDGTPNAYLVFEILLSDLPCPDDPVIWVGTEKCTIDWAATPTTQGYPVTEYRLNGKDHLWVQFDDGTQTTASGYMTGKFGSHADRPYSSDMIGRGLTKVRVTALWNRELFNGPPDFLFETTGIPLYNVAKDSSVGGSGAHRWNDTATWEPSSNPTVIAYNIRRGIFYSGEWVYGGNNKKALDASRLPASNWIAAINACNVTITNADGSTEAAYRAGGIIIGDMQPIDVIEQLLNSCNARMAEVGGVYKVHVGDPGSSVYAFTDEDIVITDGQSFEPFPSLEDVHNAIEATYPEPDERWNTKDAPGRYDTALETEDGGRRLVASVSFPMVPYKYQVQRLMKALIGDSRRFRRHTLTLPPDAFELEPNDVVSWTSTRNGYSAKKFLITSIHGKRGFNQLVALKEIDPSDYDWNAATDESAVTTGTLVVDRPAAQPMVGVQASEATFYDSANRARRPSISVSYPGEMADVRAVRVQVRLASSGDLIFDGEHGYDADTASSPSVLSVTLNGTFLPDTEYEVRVKFVPFSRRTVYWSNQDENGVDGAWLSVTTPDVGLDFADLNEALQQFQEYVALRIRDLNEQVQLATSLAADQDAGQFQDRKYVLNQITIGDEAVTASYREGILVALGLSGDALADAITAVDAASGDMSAGVLTRMTAVAGGSSGWARYAIQARAEVGYDWPVTASIFVEAHTGGANRIILQSDGTFIVDNNGNVLAAFTSNGEVVYARIPVIDTDKIAAGAITANEVDAAAIIAGKIAAGAIDTSSLMIDGVVITAKILADAVTVSGHSSTAGPTSIGTSPTSIGSVTISNDGGAVLINLATQLYNSNGAPNDRYAFMRLYRNGVQIHQWTAGLVWAGGADTNKRFPYPYVFRDSSPGVGSVTYQVNCWVDANTLSAYDTTLWVLNAKK